jgi:hypothetical protein
MNITGSKVYPAADFDIGSAESSGTAAIVLDNLLN